MFGEHGKGSRWSRETSIYPRFKDCRLVGRVVAYITSGQGPSLSLSFRLEISRYRYCAEGSLLVYTIQLTDKTPFSKSLLHFVESRVDRGVSGIAICVHYEVLYCHLRKIH